MKNQVRITDGQQSTPEDWIKGSIWYSLMVTDLNRHLQKAGKYNRWNAETIVTTDIRALRQVHQWIIIIIPNVLNLFGQARWYWHV